MSMQVAEDRPSGWIEFAAVVLFAIGFFRIISAITYFANSYKVNNLTNGLFSSGTTGLGASGISSSRHSPSSRASRCSPAGASDGSSVTSPGYW